MHVALTSPAGLLLIGAALCAIAGIAARSPKRHLIALGLTACLAAGTTMTIKPMWPAALAAVLLAGFAFYSLAGSRFSVWINRRDDGGQHHRKSHRPDDESTRGPLSAMQALDRAPDDPNILAVGLALCALAVFVWMHSRPGAVRDGVAVLLALLGLALYVARTRQSVMLWLAGLALAWIGYQFYGTWTGSPTLLASGLLVVTGLAVTMTRKDDSITMVALILVPLGGVVAAAGRPTGLFNRPLGWGIAVGIPLLAIALGLSLFKETESSRDHS
ncbi:MAG: hypothetical protein J7M25_02690 [Deltaproteobacteria bacterium]|nr:hypothetical protein [Deltaproteobacteria bacterium]